MTTDYAYCVCVCLLPLSRSRLVAAPLNERQAAGLSAGDWPAAGDLSRDFCRGGARVGRAAAGRATRDARPGGRVRWRAVVGSVSVPIAAIRCPHLTAAEPGEPTPFWVPRRVNYIFETSCCLLP